MEEIATSEGPARFEPKNQSSWTFSPAALAIGTTGIAPEPWCTAEYQIQRMHTAVVEAKAAAVLALRTGVKGSTVHQATVDTLQTHGFAFGFPGKDQPTNAITMPHGTGHGLGLSVHEPPLLDGKGTALVRGDVVTIEPGLYGTLVGGIRVEDVYAIQDDGPKQLGGTLHEGLSWSE